MTISLLARPVSRLDDLAEAVKNLEPKAQLERLELELKKAVTFGELRLLERLDFSSGYEDPVNDDGEVWDEVGVGGVASWSRALPSMRTLEDVRRARDLCRELDEENEFAIGGRKVLVNYTVGKGVVYSAVPRDREAENAELTRLMADTIERIRKQEGWAEAVEKAFVQRGHRDGEGLLRLYPQAGSAPLLRWIAPEAVKPPAARQQDAPFGVEMKNGQAVAYWVDEGGPGAEPVRLDRWHRGLEVDSARVGIPQVFHLKLNVDSNSPRGWPTMWAIRRNLARAEKLLRNMSYVAALQAAIALIKKYDNATSSQVADLIRNAADATQTNLNNGKTTDYVAMRPGTIVHAPKGQTYEAPISSVNAANNVAVLQADLRAAAVRCGMPEYMFSGDSSNAAYSSQLVAESPFVKEVETQQALFGGVLLEVLEACLVHEEFMGRLPAGACARYVLTAGFPNPVVRDQLQEAQRLQIMRASGVVSIATWRKGQGLDDVTEERHIDEEISRGYTDPRRVAGDPGKPPPGSTDGGPGGLDNENPVDGEPGRPEGSTETPAATAAPSADGAPAPDAPPAGGAETVQDTALNGAQVTALQGIVQAVGAKELAPDAAVQMLVIAFPSIGQARAQEMVTAAAAFVPEKKDPPPAPPPPAPDAAVEKKAADLEEQLRVALERTAKAEQLLEERRREDEEREIQRRLAVAAEATARAAQRQADAALLEATAPPAPPPTVQVDVHVPAGPAPTVVNQVPVGPAPQVTVNVPPPADRKITIQRGQQGQIIGGTVEGK